MMDEGEFLRKARAWQLRYDKRRILVFLLQSIAITFWIVYGILSVNMLDLLMWIGYCVAFIVLFLPGLVFILYDIYKTRNTKMIDRMQNPEPKPEDPDFTRLILKSSGFLTFFMMLVIIPAFFLVTLLEAFQWTFFFAAIFILAIATLTGACWKVNTSWTDASSLL